MNSLLNRISSNQILGCYSYSQSVSLFCWMFWKCFKCTESFSAGSWWGVLWCCSGSVIIHNRWCDVCWGPPRGLQPGRFHARHRHISGQHTSSPRRLLLGCEAFWWCHWGSFLQSPILVSTGEHQQPSLFILILFLPCVRGSECIGRWLWEQ